VSESLEADAAVQDLFHRLFGVPPERLRDDARRGRLERWDSLGHVMLLEALRDEFRIDIAPEQAYDLETVLDVKRLVAKHRPDYRRA
jgi:acyl carrier protein